MVCMDVSVCVCKPARNPFHFWNTKPIFTKFSINVTPLDATIYEVPTIRNVDWRTSEISRRDRH